MGMPVHLCTCARASHPLLHPPPVPTSVQVDGEPWVQPPTLLRVTRRGQGLVLRRVQVGGMLRTVEGWPHAQATPGRRLCSVAFIVRPTEHAPSSRMQSKPLARILEALSEVLEESEQRGTITPLQHRSLKTELSARLQPLLLHSG